MPRPVRTALSLPLLFAAPGDREQPSEPRRARGDLATASRGAASSCTTASPDLARSLPRVSRSSRRCASATWAGCRSGRAWATRSKRSACSRPAAPNAASTSSARCSPAGMRSSGSFAGRSTTRACPNGSGSRGSIPTCGPISPTPTCSWCPRGPTSRSATRPSRPCSRPGRWSSRRSPACWRRPTASERQLRSRRRRPPRSPRRSRPSPAIGTPSVAPPPTTRPPRPHAVLPRVLPARRRGCAVRFDLVARHIGRTNQRPPQGE